MQNRFLSHKQIDSPTDRQTALPRKAERRMTECRTTERRKLPISNATQYEKIELQMLPKVEKLNVISERRMGQHQKIPKQLG